MKALIRAQPDLLEKAREPCDPQKNRLKNKSDPCWKLAALTFSEQPEIKDPRSILKKKPIAIGIILLWCYSSNSDGKAWRFIENNDFFSVIHAFQKRDEFNMMEAQWQ